MGQKTMLSVFLGSMSAINFLSAIYANTNHHDDDDNEEKKKRMKEMIKLVLSI